MPLILQANSIKGNLELNNLRHNSAAGDVRGVYGGGTTLGFTVGNMYFC